MTISSFFECNFFNKKLNNIDSSFSVVQKELILNNLINANQNASFEKIEVTYECQWHQQKDWKQDRPTILIPIRDNVGLLLITLKNLFANNISKKANIIIIDDRSTNDLETIVLGKGLSFLRIDNSKGFNFSMLNNIAAKVCHTIGSKEIILWNSDLWCVEEKYFNELLKRHRDSGSVVSGSKLVYPPEELSLNGEMDTDNIISVFPQMSNGLWRETVQFGGSVWYPVDRSPIKISPRHFQRFSNMSDPRVNCDRGMCFITGALHVWDLEYYIGLGGLNPSMSKNLQDVDICLRAAENGNIPMYFGKDIYFYHDESANFHSSKESKEDMQMFSDHILFSKIWNDKLAKILF